MGNKITLNDARSAIYHLALEARWEDQSQFTIHPYDKKDFVFDNELSEHVADSAENADDVHWVRCVVRHQSTAPNTLGPNTAKKYERKGAIYIQVFNRLYRGGLRTSDEIADFAGSIFEGRRIRIPQIPRLAPSADDSDPRATLESFSLTDGGEPLRFTLNPHSSTDGQLIVSYDATSEDREVMVTFTYDGVEDGAVLLHLPSGQSTATLPPPDATKEKINAVEFTSGDNVNISEVTYLPKQKGSITCNERNVAESPPLFDTWFNTVVEIPFSYEDTRDLSVRP